MYCRCLSIHDLVKVLKLPTEYIALLEPTKEIQITRVIELDWNALRVLLPLVQHSFYHERKPASIAD
jgi:hypothetical protein